MEYQGGRDRDRPKLPYPRQAWHSMIRRSGLRLIDMPQAARDVENLSRSIAVPVRNETGAQLPINTVVYVAGTGSNGEILVDKADADDAAKMPALGVLRGDVDDSSNGRVVLLGQTAPVPLPDATFDVGDELYVSGTAGELTKTKPTGSSIVQRIAIVTEVDDEEGSMLLVGPSIEGSGGSVSGALTGLGLTSSGQRLIGRSSAGSGALEELQINSTLAFGTGTLGVADAGVGSTQLGAAAVTTTKLDGLAVTTEKIADNAITEAKLLAGSVTGDIINDNSVTTNKISNFNITNIKIAVGAVDTAQLADDAVNADKIKDAAVCTDQICDNGITQAKVAAGAICTTELCDLGVTTAKIADGAVTSAKLSDTAITGSKIASSTITSGNMAASSITTTELGADAVTNAKMADNAVTTAVIRDAAVTTAKLATGAVNAEAIGNGAVETSAIADDAVTAAKLADTVILRADRQVGDPYASLSTTSLTQYYSFTIPGGTLATRTVRVHAHGTMKNNSGSSQNFQHVVRLGGVDMHEAAGSINNDADQIIWIMRMDLSFRAAGAQFLSGEWRVSSASTAADGISNVFGMHRDGTWGNNAVAQTDSGDLALTFAQRWQTSTTNSEFKVYAINVEYV